MQLRSTWIASFVCVLCCTSADAQSGGAYLGAELGSPAPDLQKRFGGGVLILGVMPGGPAEKAGLKQGDMILDADQENVNMPQDVVDIVHDFSPGEMLELYIADPSSGYQTRTIDVTLEPAPANVNTPGGQPQPNPETGLNTLPLPSAPPPGQEGQGAASPLPQGFSASTGLIPVVLVQGQYCRALAPGGWGITDQNAQGSTFSLASPDWRMKASYGVVAINSGAGLIYVRPQGGDPATQAMTLSQIVAGEPVQVVGQQNIMGAQLFNFRGASEQGFVLYRTYPVPGDPYSYVLSFRIADGPTQQQESIAGAVASTIACVTQFHPPANGYAQVQPRSEGQATGTSAKCRAGDCDDGDLAGTYNVQLGTGYVHSETTGENFLVDPSTDYHESGPDGPGYYRQAGNSYEKLTPGWSD
jgi:hypothetical protein